MSSCPKWEARSWPRASPGLTRTREFSSCRATRMTPLRGVVSSRTAVTFSRSPSLRRPSPARFARYSTDVYEIETRALNPWTMGVRPPGSTRGSLLVVDDDEGVRGLLSRLLRVTGYSVAEAGSAEEAAERLPRGG